MNIELSIIVPVYNVEKYISQCINSIIAQTINSFEVIIVNDGSTDCSIEICKKLVEKDDRFKIINKSNGGLMSAWKEGVRHAQGKYIGFVDSDDWIDKNMYSILLDAAKVSNADIVCAGFILEGHNFSKSYARKEEYIFCDENIRNNFINMYCCSFMQEPIFITINRWDKVYRKELLLNNMQYFSENVSLGEDFNTNIAVMLDAKKIILLANFTPYHYRVTPKSIVNTINPNAFDNLKNLMEICDKICSEKKYSTKCIDSFIGDMIFQEINRICINEDNDDYILRKLSNELDRCNANRYLLEYSKNRKDIKVLIFYYFIKYRFMKPVKIFCSIYHMIKTK